MDKFNFTNVENMLSIYDEIWAVDFEFVAGSGENPDPVCLVAYEFGGGRIVRQFRDEMGDAPPYRTDSKSLVVSFSSPAEIGCHIVLGWPTPLRVLDLYPEFLKHINPQKADTDTNLLAVMAYYGLASMETAHKDAMRKLILRGGPWIDEEKTSILNYCWEDVEALTRLLPKMLPNIDFPRSLLRGRYMANLSKVMHVGTPIDVEKLTILKEKWPSIQDKLIEEVDADYGVFEGTTFKLGKFLDYLSARGMSWQTNKTTGKYDLSEQSFKDMARIYPEIAPLHELRSTLSGMRLNSLEVGSDGRSRTFLAPFRSATSRNQPSNTRFIFGPARWLRGLIKPPEGYALSYVDWEQQEFGIAAALSGDSNMTAAYQTGDPYLAFAKQAGAVPVNATKQSHSNERDLYKTCALAVQYGMGRDSLALRIGGSTIDAKHLLQSHHEVYRVFWEWSDRMTDHAFQVGKISTVFGWDLKIDAETKPRTIRNFPMQANGAEMLRLAICLACERGLRVCAPVHDAMLLMAPADSVDQDTRLVKNCMTEASVIVLKGFPIATDEAVVKFPERYMDKRGKAFWDRIMKLLYEY